MRRIQATSSEHGSNHGGSGRFAVHTRDGNPVLETHEFGEHLGPRNDRNMQPNGLEDFRIGRTNGGTYDNHIRPRDVLLTVPLKYSRAEPFQPVGDQGSLQVGTGDLVTKVEQDLGDPAHADPADTDEVNALNFCEHE